MGILEYSGCARTVQFNGCFGPDAQWWLFGAPLKSYPGIIIFALIVSLMVFSFLYFINKKTGKISQRTNIIISAVVFVILLIVMIYGTAHFYKNIIY